MHPVVNSVNHYLALALAGAIITVALDSQALPDVEVQSRSVQHQNNAMGVGKDALPKLKCAGMSGLGWGCTRIGAALS